MSGEPYIAHPLEAALFLADLTLYTNPIIAALLLPVVEYCGGTSRTWKTGLAWRWPSS